MKFTLEKALQNPDLNKPGEALRAIKFVPPFIENAIQKLRAVYTGLRLPILDCQGIIAAPK